MSGNFDNLQKGITLMKSALKKFEEGDIEGGNKDREMANHFLNKGYQYAMSAAGQTSMVYGESRNFGIAYNIFEQNMDRLLETEEGKKVIKEGFDIIRENKVLSNQFRAYDIFEKTDAVSEAKGFVSEAVKLVKRYDRNTLKENNEKFINFIKKNKLNEDVYISDDLENLYEAVETIITKKGLSGVNDNLKAQETIVEYIENKKKYQNSEEKTPTFDEFSSIVESLEAKTEKELNDEEKMLIESFLNGKTDKRKIFETHKNRTLNVIKEAIDKADDEEDKLSWREIYNKVEKKVYSDVLTENIVSCAEMIEIINEMNE